MFKWKIEDLVLYNQAEVPRKKEKIYDCESKVSREDKITFIDSLNDGKMTYILSLLDKFDKDKESLPKDNYGYVKTVSLKAWINRNDTKYEQKIIDNWYNYGKLYFMGCERYITSYNRKNSYDTYNDIVDEIFHRQLKECEKEERKYFLEHDEYSILKEEFRNKKYVTTFGVNIADWSDGRLCIIDGDDGKNEREITIDELKELLDKYRQLDKLVEKLTSETHIVY